MSGAPRTNWPFPAVGRPPQAPAVSGQLTTREGLLVEAGHEFPNCGRFRGGQCTCPDGPREVSPGVFDLPGLES